MAQVKINKAIGANNANNANERSEHQNKIINLTKSWIGTPYHHQESVKQVGCDCLGLVRGVYEELYQKKTAPFKPYTKDWAEETKQETLIEAAGDHLKSVEVCERKPGDVLIFRFRKWMIAKHTAIQVSKDTMIHAIEGAKVEEVHLNNWWQRHLAAVFRFPENI